MPFQFQQPLNSPIPIAMFSTDTVRPIEFYKQSVAEQGPDVNGDMTIDDIVANGSLPHHGQMILGDSSGGEDHEVKAPKKRAETWVQEETKSLIGFRREVDCHFNTSKSNKHLWEQIAAKMRAKGFDRSPTMCTDKWRNLLKEFKKVRQRDRGASSKMSYYKELEELLRDRAKKPCAYRRSPQPPKQDYVLFSDKGLEDASIPFGSVEAQRSTINMGRQLEHDEDPLAITSADAVAASGIPPWNWRENPGDGSENHSSYVGRVISVKLGGYTKRIGIDGTEFAIKDAIKCAFGLRTKRAFWLEDEYGVIRSLDRDMPLGNYTLQLDEGITIKVCLYDGSDNMTVRTEEKTLYTEDDFHNFLIHHSLTGLRELNGFRNIETLDGLRSGAMYQGVRLLGE